MQRKNTGNRKNKYNAKKVTIFGITFDSQKEADRWLVLRDKEKRGEILGLARQQRYVLIPSQRGKNGKVKERAVTYIADFVYVRNGEVVVEDAKGFKTEVYKIKRKLMLSVYGIEIQEV